MALLIPGLRRAVPRISRSFFVCHQCMKKPSPFHQIIIPRRSVSQKPSSSFPASRDTAIIENTSPLGFLSQKISEGARDSGGRGDSRHEFFPETSSKGVAYWLIGSAASVFGIVVFGGLTRLTESGLSITEWKPVTGSLPPMSASDWESEFAKYQSSPESKLLNPHMTLSEFQKIYFMEWTHRLWGRVIGLSFVLPTIYFIARRKVSLPMAGRLAGISGLIGFQGFIGWWMVKSGLKDDLFAPGSHPRVSQYRLTAHLGTAFLCYTAMLWNGLSILRTHNLLSYPPRSYQYLLSLRSPTLSPFRKSVAFLAVLVFTTAMSGALVAGLDAGLIYNEFPRMGLGLAPPINELFSDFYSRKEDKSDLWWRNMLENPSTVQLDHRILATTTFTTILTLWSYTRFKPAVRKALPNAARKGMLGVVHLLLLQVTLGISTLIYLVPVPLAAAHQAGSLALLTGVLVLGSRVWVPRGLFKLVAKRAGGVSAFAGKGSVNQVGRELGKIDGGLKRKFGPPGIKA